MVSSNYFYLIKNDNDNNLFGSAVFYGLSTLLGYLMPNTVIHLSIFINPSARAGYDTRLIFKWSLTGLNLEFSFS